VDHSPAARGGSEFARALARAVADLDRAAPTVPSGAGAALDARAALELQLAVYRHVERVELAARLADHPVSAV
jgi:hypothetical protein